MPSQITKEYHEKQRHDADDDQRIDGIEECIGACKCNTSTSVVTVIDCQMNGNESPDDNEDNDDSKSDAWSTEHPNGCIL